MPLGLMALVTVVMHMVSAQDRGSGSSVLRQGGVQSLQSEIVTTRTRAFLSCESGDMVVKVNFTQPFRGLMYAFRSRSSPCRVHGSGGMYYVIRIPLKGCGTWQESPRVFVNNITIRFHPALELEEDETKTLVCRYPPPLTPPPGSIHVVEPITLPPNDSTKIARAKLSEVEILLIICLLLFLSLLTLGIGIAYFCLKRKNIQLVRRKALSSAPASQLTKLSGSTPPQQSLLSGTILGHTVRIPRAVPYSASLRTYTMSDHAYGFGINVPSNSKISRDSLDSSPATSTTSGESAEGTQLLPYHLNAFTSALSIPKAVLRKDETKRRNLPSVHHVQSTSPTMNSRSGELEDQTITTVLDPEYSDNGTHYDFRTRGENSRSSTIPVYAQIDKRKQRVRITENVQVMETNFEENAREAKITMKEQMNARHRLSTSDEDAHRRSPPSPKLNIKKSVKTSHNKNDEQFKQQMVHPSHKRVKDRAQSDLNMSDATSESQRDAESQNIADLRNLCIQDISEVYVTTTVETESTEVRTTISRDIIEEHVKEEKVSHPTETSDDTDADRINTLDTSDTTECEDEEPLPEGSILCDEQDLRNIVTEPLALISDDLTCPKLAKDLLRSEHEEQGTPIPKSTDNWNVIIRQRKPPPNEAEEFPDVKSDASASSVPQFDVRIRTLPPGKSAVETIASLDRRDSTELVDVPQLKMPHSIEKIRGIIAQLETRRSESTSGEEKDVTRKTEIQKAGNSEIAAHHSKNVWWPEDPEPIIAIYSPEPPDDVSGSDSFRSKSSLRERSSSEVLEKAPTLLTQRESDNTGLERSTSEIITDRGQYSKWIRDVPVFEAYSPEFLANIPVVTQGGFFHDSYSTGMKEEVSDEKKKKPDV